MTTARARGLTKGERLASIDALMNAPPIPPPRLEQAENETRFSLLQFDKMGVGRKFYDVVLLKGTMTLAPGKLALAPEQAGIVFSDETWDTDAPERSSLKRAGEAVLYKPTTDLIVTGTARAPGDRPLPEWEAAVEVRRGDETRLAYRAKALGPRSWRHTAEKGWALTDPEPTLEVPIRYELAYGGAYRAPPAEGGGAPAGEDRWVVHAPNPSGTGFFDPDKLDPALAYRAPQWQPREHPVTDMNREVPLAGFGPVARPWASRLKYAGTYDAEWERATREDVEKGLPADYAKDFDPFFFQCAHPGLIAREFFMGDEEITLTGLMPGAAPFTVQLPGVGVRAFMIDGEGADLEQQCRLDTVHFDLDASTVNLCWRLTLNQARDIRAAMFVIAVIT